MKAYRNSGTFRSSDTYQPGYTPSLRGRGKPYRNGGPYRSSQYDYRGNHVTVVKSPQFLLRNPIAPPTTQPFKLEEAALPAARKGSRILSV